MTSLSEKNLNNLHEICEILRTHVPEHSELIEKIPVLPHVPVPVEEPASEPEETTANQADRLSLKSSLYKSDIKRIKNSKTLWTDDDLEVFRHILLES
jgi:hypothetical protein